eukprot:1046049-Pyramimonas_sp.AAC.1
MAVQRDLVDTAVHPGQGAHARQTVRNIMRERPAPTCDSERECPTGVFEAESIRTPGFSYDKKRQISE